jgi:hypothetical protein
MKPSARLRRALVLAGALGLMGAGVTACGGSSSSGSAAPPDSTGSSSGGSSSSGGMQGASSSGGPVSGPSDFNSAAPPGFSPGGGGRGATAGGAGGGSSSGGAANTTAPSAGASTPSQPARTVQETDLYRFDSTTNRLYYLNQYRGLMVFDLTNVDQPKLVGRSPIFGSPVQMFVQNSIAVVVVADWFGTLDNGSPFHGSIVRGLDATDPTNIKVLGEAKLGGWVQDLRIVGEVLYAVSEDYGGYGWVYGWGPYGGGAASTPSVIVSSVNFAGGVISAVDSKTFPGYGGVFNVTPNSIMLAHPVAAASPNLPPPPQTELVYLDISDPAGAIRQRGSINVDGTVQGWGADNGRWNLDFADAKTAHTIGTTNTNGGSGYVLATVDFSNPDTPVLDSTLAIASGGWTPAARFDQLADASGTITGVRMYLSPTYYYYSASGATTPLQVYDLTDPKAPALAGQTTIPGNVWLMLPSGNQLFALGQDSTSSSTQVSLKYLDVTKASTPALIGTSEFGSGWAWTPAADTFKAFVRGTTLDGSQGLVVLPFSGWSSASQQYNNGVQLIEYSPTTIATAGAAHTQGWVERGIFANGRIVSLSDISLGVVDYSDPLAPKVTAELTLARNVVASQPGGATIAEVSASDWWGNSTAQSDVRVLPTSDAAELADESSAPDVSVPGVDGRVFVNGNFVYVVSAVRIQAPCPIYPGQTPPQAPQTCSMWQEQVQVVDTSNGTARARGMIKLPIDPGYSWYWGWYGFYYYDWYWGSDIVQVQGNALALRRWHPYYYSDPYYANASQDLFVVDLSNPDAPTIGSTVVTNDPNGWWGNMKVVGDKLYTTHYVWPYTGYQQRPIVRYYLDQIDLSDRAHPKFAATINVPGMLVGGSDTDPSILYTIDYWWDMANPNYASPVNDFVALKLDSKNLAHEQSRTRLDGWVGNVIVRGNTAYTTTQLYMTPTTGPSMELHQIDLSQPMQPVDRVASNPSVGWGWLLDVQGDRALVESGWGSYGLDVYRLAPGQAPSYDQFVRTLGWGVSSISRQDNALYLSAGDWGVQVVPLQ